MSHKKRKAAAEAAEQGLNAPGDAAQHGLSAPGDAQEGLDPPGDAQAVPAKAAPTQAPKAERPEKTVVLMEQCYEADSILGMAVPSSPQAADENKNESKESAKIRAKTSEEE